MCLIYGYSEFFESDMTPRTFAVLLLAISVLLYYVYYIYYIMYIIHVQINIIDFLFSGKRNGRLIRKMRK